MAKTDKVKLVKRKRRPGTKVETGGLPGGRFFWLLGGGLAAGVLLAYLLVWLQISPLEIGRSDFTATYLGGVLWGQGQHTDLYNTALQAGLHKKLIAPDTEGLLPFVNAPLAAVLAYPFTKLPLDVAYRVWGLVQMGLLFGAVGIALWATPAVKGRTMGEKLGIGAVALVGTSTLALLVLGQWDGLSALGLAVAYAAWRKQRWFLGGLVLAGSSLVAKPHLAIGLALLLLGWEQRKILWGAAVGVAAGVGISLLAVGFSGVGGFLGSALSVGTPGSKLSSLLGLSGLFGSWTSNTTVVWGLAGALGLGGLGVCYWLGRRLRQGEIGLSLGLLGATAISLVISPHLLLQDLVLLAPLAAAILVEFRVWDKPTQWILGLGLILVLCELLDYGQAGMGPIGRVTPIGLLIIGGGVVAVTKRGWATLGLGKQEMLLSEQKVK